MSYTCKPVSFNGEPHTALLSAQTMKGFSRNGSSRNGFYFRGPCSPNPTPRPPSTGPPSPDRPLPDPPSAGSAGLPSLFFSLSRHNFLSFFPLLGVFSWNFGGVLKARRGFTRQPENSTRAHFRVLARQKHHQNSTRKPPREGRKKENCGGRGKKKRNFFAPPPSPTPHPSGCLPVGPHPAKIGQSDLSPSSPFLCPPPLSSLAEKFGLNKIGPSDMQYFSIK